MSAPAPIHSAIDALLAIETDNTRWLANASAVIAANRDAWAREDAENEAQEAAADRLHDARVAA